MRQVELYTNQLGEELLPYIRSSSTIYILTSFTMKSGVRLLKQTLLEAAERNADIKVCTGDYLYITQPEALEELIGIHENIQVKLFKSAGTSFHPKAYIFDNNESGVLFVGSSNMSRSALRNGIEWNLGVQKSAEQSTFEKAIEEFLKLYDHENTVMLNRETVKLYKDDYEKYHEQQPNLAQNWTEAEEQDLMLPVNKKEQPDIIVDPPLSYNIQPRFAQVDALRELETAIEEGFDKALVVMATGLGKTYLAAFLAQHFHRVLFVAHREEILYQAQRSFQNVHPGKTTGIYNGKAKEGDADFVFASISTLNQKRHLEKFAPDHFDLVVIDEFHHAAANSYKNVLTYFHPKFLLGITATPYRNDNRDIFSLCDGKVAYKIDFIEAIQHKWLAPFHYYGVYDDTDYSKIRWVGTHYDQEQLTEAQNRKELYEKTLDTWRKHKQTRTLVFCSSVRQAEALNSFFRENGHKTVSLHSGTTSISRSEAIRQLRNGEIEAIFTVDLFNEGIDIPAVDTLLFVRPTESLTVFTQQVGRGLRLYDGKKHCVIIDLIGNYRNADVKMSLFQVADEGKKSSALEPILPDNCEVNFEVAAINLLEELVKKKMPRRDILKENYFTVKQDLGKRPTYLETYQNGTVDHEMYRQEFKSFIGFLDWVGELTVQEKETYKLYKPWLEEIERTSMSKSYKMVVLNAMLMRGIDRWFLPIRSEETAPYFHQYYMSKKYRKDQDFSSANTKKLWDYDEKKVSKLIADMPMTMLSHKSGGLISFENNVLTLHFDILPEHRELLWRWTKEICEYRLHYYFFYRGIKLY
ncbi:DEAD/DEAH box helicase family protein [Bacillus sp. 165]|uniref:DEAD/DEAH box helicase family protein n=1 Tax=Bacillus sp. 165 TaxID=1529117 RepID=UPI001ADCEB7A|nr:DEAD/DEAH box helicase family protein [Bacillus sp. 165]MBO9128591.1 DEAD/DEAH box helicase family protein [Bacillus sp. 165]